VGESGRKKPLFPHSGRKWESLFIKERATLSPTERAINPIRFTDSFHSESGLGMSIFKGQETYSIDDKGRVNVPTKMRKSIQPEAGDTFVLTRGVDKCIVAYPMNEWKKYEEKFSTLNQYNEKDRFFLRMILSWSEEVEMDGQQRVSLPKRLREFAGIESKATIVGMIDHIEFWQPEEFDKYLNAQTESYEDVAAKVMTKD
jgi:MraZ protein